MDYVLPVNSFCRGPSDKSNCDNELITELFDIILCLANEATDNLGSMSTCPVKPLADILPMVSETTAGLVLFCFLRSFLHTIMTAKQHTKNTIAQMDISTANIAESFSWVEASL